MRKELLKQRQISFNGIAPPAPPVQHDSDGNIISYYPPKQQLRNPDIVRLIKPYVSVGLNEQISAVH